MCVETVCYDQSVSCYCTVWWHVPGKISCICLFDSRAGVVCERRCSAVCLLCDGEGADHCPWWITVYSRAVASYASMALAYRRSSVLLSLVGQSTYWWKLFKVLSSEAWLKSPVITMNASGCSVCSLAAAQRPHVSHYNCQGPLACVFSFSPSVWSVRSVSGQQHRLTQRNQLFTRVNNAQWISYSFHC